jgi:Tfp pilus assembly protein PilW
MRPRSDAKGFSLIELLIAMVCTMIITGAIYGLLSGGQGAFRREPALSDRQQNIRVGMDLIMRDVTAAGAGMPTVTSAGGPVFMQIFTLGLDGASLAACVDNSGAAVTCPVGASGAKTDELEILTNPDGVDMETACGYPGGHSEHVNLVSATSRATKGGVVMLLLTDGFWTLREITDDPTTTSTAQDDCKAPGGPDKPEHAKVAFNPGKDQTGYNLAGGICAGTGVPNDMTCAGCTSGGATIPGTACCSPLTGGSCNVLGILNASVVRYRIRNGADGVPNLERFASSTNSSIDKVSGARQFQVVARGIDDLQVSYTNAGDVTTDNAPKVDPARVDFNTFTQRVNVTLSARSEVQNVAGATTAAAGPAALRGTLTSSGTPRAVLALLGYPLASRATPAPSPQPTPWY